MKRILIGAGILLSLTGCVADPYYPAGKVYYPEALVRPMVVAPLTDFCYYGGYRGYLGNRYYLYRGNRYYLYRGRRYR